MDREGEGVGGYAVTQKYLGRSFRFEKYLVPYVMSQNVINYEAPY